MSRNAFDQCARELEDREEQKETERREQEESLKDMIGSCDCCGIEKPMSELIDRNGDIVCINCKQKLDEAEQEENSVGICPDCNGSGEGMFDGTTCWSCHGRGER